MNPPRQLWLWKIETVSVDQPLFAGTRVAAKQDIYCTDGGCIPEGTEGEVEQTGLLFGYIRFFIPDRPVDELTMCEWRFLVEVLD